MRWVTYRLPPLHLVVIIISRKPKSNGHRKHFPKARLCSSRIRVPRNLTRHDKYTSFLHACLLSGFLQPIFPCHLLDLNLQRSFSLGTISTLHIRTHLVTISPCQSSSSILSTELSMPARMWIYEAVQGKAIKER